jgi:hypothetical protein
MNWFVEEKWPKQSFEGCLKYTNELEKKSNGSPC